MILKLSAQRSNKPFTYSINGDIFTINGTEIDLSGDWVYLEADENDPFPDGLRAGERDEIAGEIALTVRAPYLAGANESAMFPEPMELLDGESVTFPLESSVTVIEEEVVPDA